MKTLIIGFSYHVGFNPFSTLIRIVTAGVNWKKVVSHVYLRIPVPEYNQNVIFQASGLQVNYENYSQFLSHSRVVEEYSIEISDEQAQAIERFRVTEVGKPYSVKEVVGYGWILLMRKFGFDVKNPWYQGNSAYVCENIIADILDLDEEATMTPEDLRQWIAKQPQARLLSPQ